MESRKTHYRVLRSTVVLARSSHALTQIQSDELRESMALVQARNYQFDQIDPASLEVLYASFDDAFTDRVRREFTFFPGAGSVRVHESACAICDLCGKGDSKETGDNKDHLRIEFLLKNTAGGQDVWCGSTCIINFGLKVDGAATAEEAERLLGMSMRQAVRQFEIAAWRAENPEHEDMPEQYQSLRRLAGSTRASASNYFGELVLAGYDPKHVAGIIEGVTRDFRVAVRFYQREGYLTPKKHTDWNVARDVLAQASEIQKVIQTAIDITDPDERLNHFANLYLMEKSNEDAA